MDEFLLPDLKDDLAELDLADLDLADLDLDLNRYAFIPEEERNVLAQIVYFKATVRKILFVEKLFKEWQAARNLTQKMKMPEKAVENFSDEELIQWLPYFIAEVRKVDGSKYRAKSLFEFLICLQSLFILRLNRNVQLLKDAKFGEIKNALNGTIKILQSEGLGYDPKKAEIVTPLVEEQLWINGHLGSSTSSQLVSTVMYLLGINLGLRSGEHRKLRRSMFEVSTCFLNELFKVHPLLMFLF
jgi:hypothetical protein